MDIKRKDNVFGRTVSFIFLLVLAVIFITPLLWVLISSFKVDMEINKAGGFMFFPKTWTLNNFKEILALHQKPWLTK